MTPYINAAAPFFSLAVIGLGFVLVLAGVIGCSIVQDLATN